MFGWLPSSFKGGTGEKGSVKERKAVPREVVKVVVVHSHTGGKKMWEFLEKNWQECGSVKLALSHQRFVPSHCHKRLLVLTKKTNRDFTLASLVEANPDVIICSDPAGFVSQGTDVILLLSSLALTTNTGHHTNTPSKKWTTLLSTLRTARANTFWEHTRRSTTRKGTRHSPTSTTTGSLPDCLALTPRSATQPRSSVHSPNTLPRFVVAAHQQSTQQAITNVKKTGRIQRL